MRRAAVFVLKRSICEPHLNIDYLTLRVLRAAQAACSVLELGAFSELTERIRLIGL